MYDPIDLEQKRKRSLFRFCSYVSILSFAVLSAIDYMEGDFLEIYQVEAYFRDHSDANFSHGICPECVAKRYPDFEHPVGMKKNDPPMKSG